MIVYFCTMMKYLTLTLLLFVLACSGPSDHTQNQEHKSIQDESSSFVLVKNYSEITYPDNPDIGFCSQNYDTAYFTKMSIKDAGSEFEKDFVFYSSSNDSIITPKLNISEFIPTIPNRVRNNDYLSYISCINQEWNRNQIKLSSEYFNSTDTRIKRIDISRNCLNAYLWEIIIYTEENGKVLPFAHGWFNFPKQMYAHLFESKNEIPFATYQKPLEDWIDPKSEYINLNQLRDSIQPISSEVKDLSDEMYPLKGERKRKFKEIIYPTSFSLMRDLQNDSTLFATFTPPGLYNRNDPRTTELGRFYHLLDGRLNEITSENKELIEIDLKFAHKQDTGKITRVIFGGIDLQEIPVLSVEDANEGWKNSMGIGNHTFYESYSSHLQHVTSTSPYYGLVLDGDGKWLDSHKIGIDGPLIHFSDSAKTHLHVWLLSFERHALVGHYEFIVNRF